MKSLKRTLSLVLALVMVLGLFGGISMSAAAADFTDDKDVQYHEAVDVMTGIGAIEGRGDGTFDPTGKITRAEAATMVTRAIVGANTSSQLTGAACRFTDVDAATYDWAIPSIEYMASEGILNGAGDGTFNPKGEVTGYQVAKMLLCALGYGAMGEYTGDAWEVEVAKDAAKYGIMEGRVSDAPLPSNSATREEVALYCLNTIQQQTVTFLDTLKYYSKDTYDAGGGNTAPETIMHTVYPSLDLDKAADGTVNNNGKDDFGNPARVWKLGNKTLGTYGTEATLTFNTKQTTPSATAALKGFTVKTGDVDIMKNGLPLSGTKTSTGTLVADIVTASGNGVIVKVYADNAGVIHDITATGTEIAEVSSINADTGEVTLTASGAAWVNGTHHGPYQIAKDDDLYSAVSGLKKDDRVGVIPVIAGTHHGSATGSSAKEIVPLTEVKGPITKVDGAAGAVTKITVNGTVYPVSAYATTGATGAAVNADQEATLWLDPNGFVLDCESVSTSVAPIAFLLAQTDEINNDKKLVHYGDIIWPDGTTSNVSLGTDDCRSLVGKACAVELRTDGTYALTSPAVNTASGAGTTPSDADKAIVLKANGSISAVDKALVDGTNGTSSDYFANKYAPNVKFIYVNMNTGTFEVLDGVQSVANIPAAAWATTTNVKDVDGTNTSVVNAVYLVGISPSGLSSDVKIAYFPSASKVATEAMGPSNTPVDVYTAYIDGVKVDGGIPVLTSGGPDANSFYTIAESKTITGAYAISAKNTGNDKVGLLNGLVILDYGVGVFDFDTNGGSSVDLNLTGSNAAVVDLRNGVSSKVSTPEGLAALVATNDVTVDVIYSKTNNTAVAFYITSASAKAVQQSTANVDKITVKFAKADGSTFDKDVTSFTGTATAKTATLTLTAGDTDITSGKNITTVTEKSSDSSNANVTESSGKTTPAVGDKSTPVDVVVSVTSEDGSTTVTYTISVDFSACTGLT